MERHRSLRQVYDAIGEEYFRGWSCLQFSADSAVERFWFEDFYLSEYGGQNSQDICSIDLASSSFDLAICNHVLEHIQSDALALDELLRVVKPKGLVQISFPMPHFLARTRDWGYPKQEDHGHYRHYGADVTHGLIKKSGVPACLVVLGGDPVTGSWQNVYFLSKDIQSIESLCERLIRSNPAVPIYYDS